jgi:hypothetical protein
MAIAQIDELFLTSVQYCYMAMESHINHQCHSNMLFWRDQQVQYEKHY